MSKSLVIVESPAKAKTINKFLGSNYIVKPTGGHVIDLPPKEFGIDIDKDFKPKYSVIRGKSKTLSELKKAAATADAVLLATDPDREGEAIAWHIANQIVNKGKPSYRIMINQITKNAVQDAINNKGELDLKKVNAQQARRILDRLVGYKVSPFLWKAMYSGLSAGRVQSVALRLVVERDTEIEEFVSEEFWNVKGEFYITDITPKEIFEAKLIKKDGKSVRIGNGEEAQAIVAELKNLTYSVSSVMEKKTRRNPPPPFITSTLQQDAARRLGFNVTRTMRVAQTLYEGVELRDGYAGLITYMRTDSTRIAPEAINEVRDYIERKWGSGNLPAKPNYYRAKKGAQDAHEAIRPASMVRTPESVKTSLSAEQFKLYNLIWNRFVASQMKPAESTVATADIAGGAYLFRATATRLDYPGFLMIYGDDRNKSEEEPKPLPAGLKKDTGITLQGIDPTQHFTKPPAHYTEASLVKELEAKGIGRPSTYAQIINTIVGREYVARTKGKLISTELGRKVNGILVTGFPALFNVDFTASMEEDLDRVESGEYEWLTVVREFYQPFNETLEKLSEKTAELKESLIETTGEKCPECGSDLVVRWGRNGKFIACSGFPQCKFTRPLDDVAVEKTDEKCDKCGSPMEVKTGKYGRFLACSNYPKCKNIKPFSLGVKCPVDGCDGEIVEKRTRRGKIFYGCNRYPACTFASWTKPVAAQCPDCGSPTLLESQSGDSYSCPQCKNKFEAELIETSE